MILPSTKRDNKILALLSEEALQFQTNQNYTRLETDKEPFSETLKTRNQAAGVREVEETVEKSQALEPLNAPPDLTLGVLACL